MARGLPVVTTEMNGASESLRSGENGVVVRDPAHIKSLAEAVVQALEMKREAVGSIHQRILIRHTWDRHLEELLKLYMEVTKFKVKRPPMEVSPGEAKG